MIKDVEVNQLFEVTVTLDHDEAPITRGNGADWSIHPSSLSASWAKLNGESWQLGKVLIRGLRDDHRGTGLRSWYPPFGGSWKSDPPPWVLEIISEVKPNDWRW